MISVVSVDGGIPDLADHPSFKIVGAGAIILTHDNLIILQRRSDDAPTAPGVLCGFGGGLEDKETYLECLQRELYEELHAKIDGDAILLGAAQFLEDQPDKLACVYFWHDRAASIDGCYEGTAETYSSTAVILSETKLEYATKWALQECVRRGLIPA